MKKVFSKTCSLKWLFLCVLGIVVASCITVQRHVSAEGQTKYSKDFFDSAETIKIKDPLAVVLGAMDKGEVFTFTYADAVKFAGHSCPAVAGAYKSTQLALKALYGEEVPVRGNIKVTFKGGVDYKVNGPISQVVTLITGASAESGFKGLGPAGKYGRYNLMAFNKDISPDPKAICSMIFQRADSGKKIEVTYSVEPVLASERMDKLMPLVISGKASEDESKEFGNLWQERVKTILLSPPEGAFIVKELKD
ncbi:MAG TPA: hypothetical protein ACFYEK_14025 [Candidatus Wunengus sp. YC60]|uniref:hypothetical protein n=1 Tax=Candidatus Wunengus sp. YC60 TaxID=3367697 RepID=UPI0040260CE9